MQWDFPGSPVVRTLRFHCRAHRNHPWRGKSYPTCYAAWPKKKKSNALSRCDERQLYSTPKPCPNGIFRRTWTPLPAFHQSNPLAGPLSRLKHHTCTFWKASQLSRTLTVVTTLAVRGDANASVYLTDSYTGVRSKPRAKQALLNRQAAPKGMRDSHPYKQSLKVSPLRKTSHSQLLPNHSALTNTPNSLEMPGIKHSPGPVHQRSV